MSKKLIAQVLAEASLEQISQVLVDSTSPNKERNHSARTKKGQRKAAKRNRRLARLAATM